MSSEIINPNLHVAFIHYPLALIITGTLIELFSFLWPRSGINSAAKWMILLGALSSVPATFSGIYALRDIAHANNPVDVNDAPWVDVKVASPFLSQPNLWKMLKNHALFQSVATTLSVLTVVLWLGGSDRARKWMRAPLLLLLLATIASMTLGAWNGGEAVYRHGVGVDIQSPSTLSLSVSILELHLIGAGFMIALASAAIGMSFRKMTVRHAIVRDASEIALEQQQLNPERQMRTPASSMAMLRSFNPGIELTVTPFAPAARFWLLASLLAILTASGGIYILLRDSDALATTARTLLPILQFLWNQIKPEPGESINRPLAHVVAGAALILLPLLLAALVRYAPRRHFWMGFLSLILIGVIGSQIWLGILLLFDTSDGSVLSFNPSADSPPKTALP